MPDPKTTPCKKVPKQLAVIWADRCTGCGACIEVCPVDCIVRIDPDLATPGMQGFCEVDWDRCIGCKLCIRIPKRKSDPYRLLVCPWEAIEMVPLEDLAEAAVRIGGPPGLAEANRDRLLAIARRQVDSTGEGNGATG